MPRTRKPPGPAHSPAQQLGNEIRHWRELRGLSVQELASDVERDRRTITGVEDARDRPSETLINLIDDRLQSGGLIVSYYDAVIAENRRQRLNRRGGSGVAPDASEQDASVFLRESVPDGTLVLPGHRFEKTWTIRNAGAIEWENRYLTRIGIAAGPGLITTPHRIPLPVTQVGEELTIVVPCIAQFVEGTSRAVFKMTDAADRLYFPQARYTIGLQVQVTVVRELHPE